MGTILNIDTSEEQALICIGAGGTVVAERRNAERQSHAAFLQPAIAEMFREANLPMSSLDAIAITEGPGSYTGLRVGMSSAKGLCYALGIPLITVNTLTLLAAAAIARRNIAGSTLPPVLCPMIDARRMEVFTAAYTPGLVLLEAPGARILEAGAYEIFLEKGPVLFFGSGSNKWQSCCTHPAALFDSCSVTAPVFCQFTQQLFDNQQFTTLAYSEPYYGKSFFSTQKRQPG